MQCASGFSEGLFQFCICKDNLQHPEDTLSITVIISVAEAVCMWSKCCGFLTPYMSAGGTKLFLKMLFLRDYCLFSSSFVVMTVEGKNTGKLLFEMMMFLEKELPTWSHQALPRKVWSFASSLGVRSTGQLYIFISVLLIYLRACFFIC